MSRRMGLEKLGVDLSKLRGNATVCPKCSESRRKKNDKCLSVNIEQGNVKCNHCGWQDRADSDEWIQKEDDKALDSLMGVKPKQENKTSNIKPFHSSPVSQKGIEYLNKRGIFEKTIKENSIAEYQGVLCFNYYNGDQIVSAKYRLINEKKFWQHAGCEAMLYNLNGIKNSKYAIICEGEIDALSFYESGFISSVSVNQGAPNPNDSNTDAKLKCLETCGKYLNRLEKIYIAVDKDANGRFLEEELIRRFGKSRCWLVEYPEDCKDANDVLVKHGKAALKGCIANAKAFPVSGVIMLSDVRDSMLNQFKNGVKKGKTTHFQNLNKHFTWLSGDLNVWTGLANTGKSEFLKNLIVAKTLHDGWKWAIFTPEHAPAEDFYFEFVETMVGKSTDKFSDNKMSYEELEMAMDLIDKFIFFIYPEANDNTSEEDAIHTPDIIAEKIKALCATKGIKGYVIDPWNQLMHTGMDKREDLYLAVELSKLDRLNKEYDLCGNIVAHPKGIPPNKDGIIRKPTGFDISGGTMWMNKAYNVIIIHREKIDGTYTNEVEVEAVKIKKQKRVGRLGSTKLEFNSATGWYYEFVNDELVSPLEGIFDYQFMGAEKKDSVKIVNLSDAEMMKRNKPKDNDEDIPF